MKIVSLLSGVAVLMTSLAAGAHSHLHSVSPAEGSKLTTSPPNVVLHFSEAVTVTAAWIQSGKEPKQKLGSLPAKPAEEITIPVPTLAPGSYEVTWRVLSDDGHIMPGKVHFTISSGAEASPSALK